MVTEADRMELATRWRREIQHTSYVPLPPAEIDNRLADFASTIIEVLEGRAALERARQVGQDLVRTRFTNSEVLSRTLRLFAERLLDLVPGASVQQVSAVLGELATGFACQLREQSLQEQEALKQAVLRARDEAEQALRASEARSRAVFNSSPLGIAIVNLDGVIEETNLAMREIFNCPESKLIGASIYDLVDEQWRDQLRRSEADLLAGRVPRFHVQTCSTAPDGGQVWTQLSASLVCASDGAPEYQVLLYEDITQRHMLQEQFRRQATRDPLTGLANRTLLQTKLEEALQPLYPGRRVGLCYFGLDGFKAINDSAGHSAGDKLLRAVAQRMENCCTDPGNLVARLGGDEFLVLVADSNGAGQLIELVETIRREITQPVRVDGHELRVLSSVGVLEREVAGATPEALLRDVDITLYRAKRDGRAQWGLFDPEDNAHDRKRFQLSAALPAALDQDELFVEYEPVVRLRDHKVVAATAVVRWDHPELGELPEEEFLALAEETGLIVRLGNWVLERACQHASQWREEGFPQVVVSLTPRHTRDPDLVASVQEVLRSTGLPPSSLVLSLPEEALFDQHGDPSDILDIFTGMGIRLFVYEFGSEYSRVPRLRGLPLAGVRIDGPHVANFEHPEGPDPLNRYLVQAAVGAAELMELPVLATGVRTRVQAERLHQLGVELVQGEYSGGVVSASEMAELAAGS